MGATFNRVKTWIAEKLTASDLNAEFNNILNNLTPGGVDDYSSNVSQMQAQTDPGEVGSESLAASLSDEIERLRYEIAQIKGTTYWYTNPATSLATVNAAFGAAGLSPSRLVSGANTGNSNQSVVLVPQGSGNGDNITITGTPSTLTYVVDDTQYTLTSDVTLASQSAAPASNNTALVNDASLAAAEWTKYTGLYGGGIPIDNIGSEITSRNGDITCLRLDEGTTATEYILCIPDTTNDQIKNVHRGWFFDENGAAIPPIAFSNNATLTLMRINWIFLDSSGTLSNTYNTPVVSSSAPSTPTVNDYWYDLSVQSWKIYNGVSFVTSNAVFVGMSIIDENGDCVAARSEDFVTTYLPINTLELELVSSTQVASQFGGRAGVDGTLHQYFTDQVTWDITTDLDQGTESASTVYFFYIDSDGDPIVSATAPDDFTSTRGGYYHPSETWRCFGQAWNNASSNLEKVISYHTDDQSVAIAESSVSANALTLAYWSSPLVRYNMYSGDSNAAKEIKFPIYQNIVVPSGATLSHPNSGTGSDLINDSIVLHVMAVGDFAFLGVSAHQRGQGELVTTTAMGTDADSALVYSVQAITDAFCKGVAHGLSAQTTAGTWASNLSFFRAVPNLNTCRVSMVSQGSITSVSPAATVAFYVNKKRFFEITYAQNPTTTAGLLISNVSGSVADSDIVCTIDGTEYGRETFYCINTGGNAQLVVSSSSQRHIVNPDSIASEGVKAIGFYRVGAAGSLFLGPARTIVREYPYDGDL